MYVPSPLSGPSFWIYRADDVKGSVFQNLLEHLIPREVRQVPCLLTGEFEMFGGVTRLLSGQDTVENVCCRGPVLEGKVADSASLCAARGDM